MTTHTTPTAEGFVLIKQETYEYNHAHQVIKTTHANGKFSTAEWICSGPLTQTDEDGLTTQYQYNSAKTLSRITRQPHTILPEYQTDSPSPIPPEEEELILNATGLPLMKKTTRGDTVTTTHYTYDHAGRITSETDPMGLLTTYTYSDDGLTTTRITPAGATFVTTYHSDGTLLQEGGSGQQSKYYSCEIRDYGLSTSVYVGPSRLNTILEIYDGLGNIICEETFTYVKSYFYDQRANLIQSYMTGFHIEDIADIQTMEYDSMNQLVRHIDNFSHAPDDLPVKERITEWDYQYTLEPGPGDYASSPLPFRKKTNRIFNNSGQAIEAEEKQYIGTHLNAHLISADISTDKFGAITQNYTENKHGNIIHTTRASTFEGEIITLTLDGHTICRLSLDNDTTHYQYLFTNTGTQTTTTSASGLVETHAYNLNAQELTYTRNHTLLYTNTYSPHTGFLTRKTHSDNTYEAFIHDHRGRLTAQYGTAAYPVRYQYDDQNHITALHTFRLTESIENNPLSREDGDITHWTYSPTTGLLTRKQYPDGSKQEWEYDFKNRTRAKTLPGGHRVTYKYGPSSDKPTLIQYSDQTPSVHNTYNHLGELIAVTDAGGTRTITYDHKAAPLTEELTGPINQTTHYTRDQFGRAISRRIDWEDATIHEELIDYDPLGRITALHIDNLAPFSYTFDTDKGGLPSQLTYPFPCEKKVTYQPNTPIPAQITYQAPDGTPIYTQDITSDHRDIITRIDTTTLSAHRQNTYAYNTRRELTTYNHPETNPQDTTTITYDTLGNRIWKDAPDELTDYTTNTLNQYTQIRISSSDASDYTPAHDIRGNQTLVETATGQWRITYDLNNRPTTFTQGDKTIQCQYDSQGRRVEKTLTENNTLTYRRRYTYRGYLLIAEWDTTHPSPILLRTYHWDPREETATRPLLLKKCTGDTPCYLAYLHTRNKDVSHLLNQDGTIAATYTYDPFGNIIEETGSEDNPFRFSSEYYDEELGLIYYNYRHYNPRDGRWISREPLGEEESLNLYLFVINNPIKYVDVTGQFWGIVIAAAVIATAVAAAYHAAKELSGYMDVAENSQKEADKAMKNGNIDAFQKARTRGINEAAKRLVSAAEVVPAISINPVTGGITSPKPYTNLIKSAKEVSEDCARKCAKHLLYEETSGKISNAFKNLRQNNTPIINPRNGTIHGRRPRGTTNELPDPKPNNKIIKENKNILDKNLNRTDW